MHSSLDSFRHFYINRFADHHGFESMLRDGEVQGLEVDETSEHIHAPVKFNSLLYVYKKGLVSLLTEIIKSQRPISIISGLRSNQSEIL